MSDRKDPTQQRIGGWFDGLTAAFRKGLVFQGLYESELSQISNLFPKLLRNAAVADDASSTGAI